VARVGGKRAGRVSVVVIPDATRFRASLKLMLKRVEQSMSVNLAATADTSSAEATLRRFTKDWNGRQVSLGAGVATGAAAAQLRLLSRPRVVPMSVRVSKASIAKAATIISSLTGARLAGDFVKGLSDRLQNLDRALPKIAAVSLGIASLSAVLIAAVGGTFTLGAGLVQILGLAALLPGILTGIAVGGVVLGLALSDIKTRLADLAPEFQDLRSVVTDNYWEVAEQPIRDFIGSLLPALRTGLGRTATAVGNWSSSVVASFQNALGNGVIDQLFDRLVTSIDIASTGTGGFAQALVVLGAVGADYLPALAGWVADLSNRFNEFITAAAADGSLKAFLDGGIIAAQQFGSALASAASILAGIATAAEAGGGGGLATFADVLDRVATVVNSPAFQKGMSTIFAGAEAGAAGLGAALGPIGRMFSVLAPLISSILASSGVVVGKFLGDIAKALESPAFQKGLGGFFDGLQDGLSALGTALPALADALGVFLGFAGEFGAELGPVLAATLIAIAPLFVKILEALEPLLPVLGDAFIKAIQDITPSLVILLDELLPLLPSAVELVAALLGFLGAMGTPTGLDPTLLTVVVGGLSFLLSNAAGLYTFFSTIIAFLGTTNGSVGDLQQALLDIPGPFGDMLRASAGLMEGIINSMIDGLNGLRGAVSGFVNWVTSSLGIKASISFGEIPHMKVPNLATGADILATPGGVHTVLGEGGRAERVIDRGLGNRNLRLSNALAERALAAGRGYEGPAVQMEINAVDGPSAEVIGATAAERINFEWRQRR
jgi:hypothetical protein